MNNIELWLNALNWKDVPEFGPIHKLKGERFNGCYYCPETVAEVIDSIGLSLSKNYGFTNKTIIGAPGSGKTTFVYFLKKYLTENGTAQNFHIEIVHLQRLIDELAQKPIIDKRVLAILQTFFHSNNLGKNYEDIVKDEAVDKERINRLEDFIVLNKELFKKKLIIIIDDVDETPEKVVEECVRHLYSLLECEQVSKWLVIRAATLDNYSSKFLDWIATKFSRTVRFPRVDLHGILEKRIMHDNPQGINPFIPEWCHLMVSTYGFDLRAAVANSISFLELLPPPKTSQNNPSFIGHYFKVNFTKVMSQIGVFPNIYLEPISHTVPLEKDVFLIMSSQNRFEGGDLSRLIDHYRNIYAHIHGRKYVKESVMINFDMDHINQVISYLCNHRLIEKLQNIKDFYVMTPRGESFVKFVLENEYTAQCKKEITNTGDKRHPVFWDLASQFPDISVSRK